MRFSESTSLGILKGTTVLGCCRILHPIFPSACVNSLTIRPEEGEIMGNRLRFGNSTLPRIPQRKAFFCINNSTKQGY